MSYAWNPWYSKGVQKKLPKAGIQYVPLPIISGNHCIPRLQILASQQAGLRRFALDFLCFSVRIAFSILRRAGFAALWNLIVFCHLLQKTKPDIVHINNGGYPGAWGVQQLILAAEWIGMKRIIYTVNNQALLPNGPLDKWMDRLVERNTAIFTTASRTAKERLAAVRGMDPAKILQIVNAVVREYSVLSRKALLTGFFPSAPIQRLDNLLVITQVGILTKRKGQRNTLAAVKHVISVVPDLRTKIKVFLVGNGEDESILRSLIAELELSDIVVLTGFRPDYIEFVAACDIYMQPSNGWEDMPLVVLSAMQCGKPVLGTAVAGLTEEVVHGKTGYLEDLGERLDVRLGDRLLELYRDSKIRHQMGEMARERVDCCFSVHAVVKRYLELYEDVLKGKAPTRA